MNMGTRLLSLFILAASILNPEATRGPVLLIYHGNTTVNRMALFTCVHSGGDNVASIQWLIDGRPLESLALRNVTTEFDNGAGVLTFSQPLPEYNMLRVKCQVTFRGGTPSPLTSCEAQLLVQGLLSSVDLMLQEMETGNITLTWTSPPTIFVQEEPDTAYCVDVFNSTSSARLHSICNLSATGFSYPVPPEAWCHQYYFTVTPVNSVGNGSVAPAFFNHTGALEAPQLQSEYRDRVLATETTASQSLNMSALVCSAQVEYLDEDTGETLMGTDLTISGDVISYSHQLTDNRHYMVTITASNVAGGATSQARMSTHDISSAQILETTSGLEMTTNYFDSSTSIMAALYCLISTRNGVLDFNIYLCLPLSSQNYTLPHDRLSRGEYRALVYDIEPDGTLQSNVTYPATVKSITSNSGGGQPGRGFPDEPPHLTSCQVTNATRQISVECSFAQNSEVFGFQVLVHQINLTEAVHRLYTGMTTNRQTPVSVDLEENGEYQVTVFPLRRGHGIVDSNMEYTSRVVLADPVKNRGFVLLPQLGVLVTGLAITSFLRPTR